MKNLIYIILFIIIPFFGTSQNFTPDDYKKLDSLNALINNPQTHDTTKINARSQFGELNMIYRAGYWDSISNDCDAILKQKPTKEVQMSILKMQAATISNLGVISNHEGTQENTLKYFKKGLEINQQIGNQEGVAELLENIGVIYSQQGKIVDALTYYNKSLVISESINNKKQTASTYNRIAQVNFSQNNIKGALKNFNKSLAISTEINDKDGIANCLTNIANVYKDYGDPDFNNDKENILIHGNKKALEYYLKSLEIYEELGKKYSIATVTSNIGSIYNKHGDPFCNLSEEECLKNGYKIALVYSLRSLEIRKEIGDKIGITSSLVNMAYVYYNMRKISDAENSGLEGLKMSQQMGLLSNIRNAAFVLTEIYKSKEGEHKSLDMFKLYILMRDSLNNESTQKATLIQETQFEYEKQKALDDAKNDKLIAIEQQEKEKQKIIAYAIGFMLLLVVVFLFFVFNRLRITKKQKNIIEEQKDVVEIAHQQLSEKNKEITDSIHYAKRIQAAILPSNKVIKESLQESFILYKPKDIVAGDFYWLEQKNGIILFAAADCTGHGVPGAMVSVVCNNGLNRSVREHGLTDPGAILNKTREIVIEEFEKSEDEVKDGMDIALCSLKQEADSWQLQYAGANNPLWIIRSLSSSTDQDNQKLVQHLSHTTDDYLLYEIKPDKQPIGKYAESFPYTTHTIELKKGDSIYIFSDGYSDQFGGEKGKKFKAANFKNLLLSIQSETIENQKQLINDNFENWKGNLEQLDDVCVIGVRI